MLIGYARVSKADGSQSVDLQLDELVAAGVGRKQIYVDHASGKKDDRPGLESCMKALRKGDTLLVWKLDRLGRNLGHLVDLVDELHRREVSLKVLKG
ncbi:MAG: recombinase family protein, partial [Candidatus Obscuribacter sp.]|nr:recombinase family protein [Candidatus Obscuribacter sp.]